jgi:hypothetical protein
MKTMENDNPWDELEDQAQSEGRVIVDAIKEAKRRGETEITIHGVISPESTRNLQAKNFCVEAGMADGGIQTKIRFAGTILSKPAKAREPPKPQDTGPIHVKIPNSAGQPMRGTARDMADQTSPAYLMMQQRERDNEMFARQNAGIKKK